MVVPMRALSWYVFALAIVFVHANSIVRGNLASETSTVPAEPPFTTERVALRDGVKIVLDYFLPSPTGRFPTIIEITPYGRDLSAPNFRNEAAYWIKHGYAFVIADTRGTGESEGKFVFIAKEGVDAYDLIEWIARQPWSNGRVTMRGASYSGVNQWAAALQQPPHLSCISPSATLERPMRDVPYDNGAFTLWWALTWIGSELRIALPSTNRSSPDPKTWLKHRPLRTLDLFATGREIPLYRTFLDHPTYDDFWRSIDFPSDAFKKIKIPTLAFTGWFDSNLRGTLQNFHNVRNYSTNPNDHFLFIGPYVHTTAVDGGYDYLTLKPIQTAGDFIVPQNGLLPALDMTRKFYDWCMKGEKRPDYQTAKIFITGTNRWMTRTVFPPPESQERWLYLNSAGRANGIKGDGTLQWSAPTTNTPDRYRYDPSDPVTVDMVKTPFDLPLDINGILDRNDVLVYTTEIIAVPLTVIGDVFFELHVQSTARDTDFIVELMDVMPDGRSIKFGSRESSQLRLRYREGLDREVLMTPGTVYAIKIPMGMMGHTFLPGHRIRMAIMSSLYPWFNPNLNTGNPVATDMSSGIVANQTVLHSAGQPSRIRLMVASNPVFDP